MLSKNKLKLMRSLTRKKERDAMGLFVAEGPKAVGELAVRFRCRLLVATEGYLAAHPDVQADEVCTVTEAELGSASSLTTAHEVIAVFCKPESAVEVAIPHDELSLALDCVQDPGNLGTIIRLADWFGIRRIFCSPDTADAFAPKVVQATMGALARVEVVYGDLPTLLAACPEDFPVYGTFLDGDNMYATPLSSCGVIVMGNEGNGISAAVERVVTHRLHIPSFPPDSTTVESLNVAVATAVVCAEFRRHAL